jgi:hypothetical protein
VLLLGVKALLAAAQPRQKEVPFCIISIKDLNHKIGTTVHLRLKYKRFELRTYFNIGSAFMCFYELQSNSLLPSFGEIIKILVK